MLRLESEEYDCVSLLMNKIEPQWLLASTLELPLRGNLNYREQQQGVPFWNVLAL
jgi:hypothetical protein